MFKIVQGSLLPPLRLELKWDDNTPVDLTEASKVELTLKKGTTTIVTGECTIETPALGLVRYDWVDGDTNELGLYQQWVTVTIDSKTMVVPNIGSRMLLIIPMKGTNGDEEPEPGYECKNYVTAQSQASSVGEDQKFKFAMVVINPETGPISEENIIPGTYNLVRNRGGSETIIESGVAFSKSNGLIYTEITFTDGNWDNNDYYCIVPTNDTKIKISSLTFFIPVTPWIGRIANIVELDVSAIKAKTDLIRSDVGSGILNDDNTFDTIIPDSLPTNMHLALDISDLNHAGDDFTIEVKVGTLGNEQVVAWYNLISDGTNIKYDDGTIIKQRIIDISDILVCSAKRVIISRTKNSITDRDVPYEFMCGV